MAIVDLLAWCSHYIRATVAADTFAAAAVHRLTTQGRRILGILVAVEELRRHLHPQKSDGTSKNVAGWHRNRCSPGAFHGISALWSNKSSLPGDQFAPEISLLDAIGQADDVLGLPKGTLAPGHVLVGSVEWRRLEEQP